MAQPLQRKIRLNFVRKLADPIQLSLAEAVAATKADLDSSNTIDEELVDLLADEIETKGGAERSLRILEILSELGLGPRVMSLKLPLVAHEDERVRSKAVLIIGREVKSADWVMRRMLDPDPGVQANAIESVWGVQSPEMHRLLDRAARSRNNRVAANGLVGLYILDDVSSIPRLFEMAEHSDDLFRQSARWAMGETRDARFLPFLVDTYKRATNGSKGIIFGAMARIRKQLNSAKEAGCFHLRAADWREITPGSYSFRLFVVQEEGQNPPSFASTGFVLEQGSHLVTKYAVTAQPNPALIVSAFAIPRTLSQDCAYRNAVEDGLAAAVKTKRASDLWWIQRYRTNEVAHQNTLAAPPEDRGLTAHRRANQNLLADEAYIARFIPGPGRLDDAASNITACIRRLLEIVDRIVGARHIFVCFEPDCLVEDRAMKKLTEAVTEAAVILHGIVPTPESDDFTPVRQLCESTGGTFHCLPVDQISAFISTTHEQLLNRYDITYEAPEATSVPQVRIISQQGCAELA